MGNRLITIITQKRKRSTKKITYASVIFLEVFFSPLPVKSCSINRGEWWVKHKMMLNIKSGVNLKVNGYFDTLSKRSSIKPMYSDIPKGTTNLL